MTASKAFFKTLTFSQKISIGALIATSLWLLSSFFPSHKRPPPSPFQSMIPRVQTEQSHAALQNRIVQTSATLQYTRVISLVAETAGHVIQQPLREGTNVQAEDVILQLDPEPISLQIEAIRSKIAYHDLKYAAAKKLVIKNLQSESQAMQLKAHFDQGLAEQALLTKALAQKTIKAPFSGILTTLHTNIGDYIKPQQVIGTLVDPSDMIVTAQLSWSELKYLRLGTTGYITLAGTPWSGHIRYIGQIADPKTKTFRVELLLEKTPSTQAGLPVLLTLQGDKISTHTIAASLLTLNPEGHIGVKILIEETVHFVPVEVIGETKDGILVTGLPEVATLITVGQEFVQSGQHVQVTP